MVEKFCQRRKNNSGSKASIVVFGSIKLQDSTIATVLTVDKINILYNINIVEIHNTKDLVQFIADSIESATQDNDQQGKNASVLGLFGMVEALLKEKNYSSDDTSTLEEFSNSLTWDLSGQNLNYIFFLLHKMMIFNHLDIYLSDTYNGTARVPTIFSPPLWNIMIRNVECASLSMATVSKITLSCDQETRSEETETINDSRALLQQGQIAIGTVLSKWIHLIL